MSASVDELRSNEVSVRVTNPPPPPRPSPVVHIDSPADGTITRERVISVRGSISHFSGSQAILTVNGRSQSIEVSGGRFSATVILTSGDNHISVRASEGGRSGSASITVTNSSPPTRLWVQLTWQEDLADVDLYVTEPNGETAWFEDKRNSSGGFLDVDDIDGFGPERGWD